MASDKKYIKNSKTINLTLIIFLFAVTISFVIYLFPFNVTNQSEDISKKIYYVDSISPTHQKIINRFNEKYRGLIEVIPIDLPFSKFTTNERKEIIARALRGTNNKIDIFAVDQIWVKRFSKWAEPLNGLLSPTEKSSVLSYALETCEIDSKLISLPIYIDIGVLYYRKDIINKKVKSENIHKQLQESITWEELIELKEKYFQNDPIYIIQGQNYEGLICNLLEFTGGNDGEIYSNGKFTLTNPSVTESIQFMNDLIHKYNIAPIEVVNFTENDSYKYALQNDIPFFRGWPTMQANVEVSKEDSIKLNNIVVASLPHFKGKSPATVFGGWNMMISKDSNVKDEAKIFMKYILSEEIQRLLYQDGGYLPVLNDLYHKEETNANLQYFLKLMEDGQHRPSLKNYTLISGLISKRVHDYLLKPFLIENGLNDLNKNINSILEKN